MFLQDEGNRAQDAVPTSKGWSRKQNRPSRQPQSTGQSGHGLRKSTLLGIYLYIAAHYRLEDRQVEYIARFQGRLNLSEIQRALKFAHTLTTDPRTRARVKADSVQVPFFRPRPFRFEQRRIGVGYRDKGSLPRRPKPSWDKDNTLESGYTSIFEETRSWDLTILFSDSPPVHGDEPDRDLPVGGKVRSGLPPRPGEPELVLWRTGEKTWCISAPSSPSLTSEPSDSRE